jgi:flavin reductase (DIM6/NTAB) family NADH-FMN oxidoreductase RutF
MAVTNDVFRNAMSAWASGVNIVSTAQDGARRGITASAFSSVCANPPQLLVCLNTSTGTWKMIEEKGWFAVNILSEADQDVAEIFAGRNGLQGDDRFQHGDWIEGENEGLPILETALASIECRVEKIELSGTHAVVFGTVEKAHLRNGMPLLYHATKFHTLPGERLRAEDLEPEVA